MNQHITIHQLDELTYELKCKLRDLFLSVGTDYYYDQEGNIYTKGFPLVTTGQMLLLLIEWGKINMFIYKPYWTNGSTINDLHNDIILGKYKKKKTRNQKLFEFDTHKTGSIMRDVLWEMTKDLLKEIKDTKQSTRIKAWTDSI